MLVELHNKAGRVCEPASEGMLKCPLIIRKTSEDFVTANIVQALRIIRPRWWLPELLNQAFPQRQFRKQVFRKLQITLWENRPRLPRSCLPADEGSTQVDTIIRWENLPTTVYIEFKYLSPLAHSTKQGADQDQLLRNIRVGLFECGYYDSKGLFPTQNRRFYQLVVTPHGSEKLVSKYQDRVHLQSRLEESPVLPQLPELPFIGELNYRAISNVLSRCIPMLSPSEKIIANDLCNYLELKLNTAHEVRNERQSKLPLALT